MNKTNLLITAAGTMLFLGSASHAYANSSFGSCLNPQAGASQVNVGPNHGVIGIGAFDGTDTIYNVNGNVLQCLCTSNGQGYQTDWLKASGMSQGQIESYKAQGWMYTPYGEDWGLDKGPYLAKNTEYNCASCTPTPAATPSVTETPTPGPSATPTPTSTTTTTTTTTNNNTTNNNTTNNNTTNNSGSSVLGAMASTGNAFTIYASILAGAASLVMGLVLKKFSK
jgi:cell division septation protein DedD